MLAWTITSYTCIFYFDANYFLELFAAISLKLSRPRRLAFQIAFLDNRLHFALAAGG
jgi:hypothetical protein